jgi:ubiquinone/menaquinone biosynthesis C-methylase UbiE
LLTRTTIKSINNILNKNSNWRILDIGCGYTANNFATVVADSQDLSKFYKHKEFIQIDKETLPFKDKEFDFVIASHVIEHVKDFEFFLKELSRIASKGYIELPSRMSDNLVFENKTDHLWWFKFDDIEKKLIVSKKNQLIDPFISVATSKILESIFRESLIIELYWENSINYKIDNDLRNEDFKKISFFKIVKKFLSKKIRNIFK